MKFHGRLGGNSSSNGIFRLTNKFSMRYYQSAIPRRCPTAATPLYRRRQSICFIFGRFDSPHFTTTLTDARCGFSSFASLYRFVCTDLDRNLLGDLLLIGCMRFKNIEALQMVDLTLAFYNSVNTFIAKQDTTDFLSPNWYRYKIVICKLWVGLSPAWPLV